jgi:hypothetical protein
MITSAPRPPNEGHRFESWVRWRRWSDGNVHLASEIPAHPRLLTGVRVLDKTGGMAFSRPRATRVGVWVPAISQGSSERPVWSAVAEGRAGQPRLAAPPIMIESSLAVRGGDRVWDRRPMRIAVTRYIVTA